MVTFEQILELVRKAKNFHEYLDFTISPLTTLSLFNNEKCVFMRTDDEVNYYLSYMREVCENETDIDAEQLEILVFGKKLGGD